MIVVGWEVVWLLLLPSLSIALRWNTLYFMFWARLVCLCMWLGGLLQVKSCPFLSLPTVYLTFGEGQRNNFISVLKCTNYKHKLHSSELWEIVILFCSGFVSTFHRVNVFGGSSLRFHFYVYYMQLFVSLRKPFIRIGRAFCLVCDTDTISAKLFSWTVSNHHQSPTQLIRKVFIKHVPPTPNRFLSTYIRLTQKLNNFYF